MYVLECSRAISRVSVELKTGVSEIPSMCIVSVDGEKRGFLKALIGRVFCSDE
jgi:hypothetical protein